MKDTIKVNLFAGPGTGKSTTAAEIYVLLKKAGVDVELVREFAKDLVWRDVIKEYFQEDIARGQKEREDILIGKVDVIVTDSPYIQGAVYSEIGEAERIYGDSIKREKYGRDLHNVNIFLERTKKYKTVGREQTEEEAKELDQEIKEFLIENSINHKSLSTNEAVPYAVYEVIKKLTET